MKKTIVIQGLQYGSEAKGAVAAGVAKAWLPDTVATAWGPNAGHTVRDGDFKFVSSMLATSALYPSINNIMIGPGSVLDLPGLTTEIELAGDRLCGKTLYLHPQAAILKPSHRELERDLLRIGSTMKGTMQAAVGKMHRNLGAVMRGNYGEGEFSRLLIVAGKIGLYVNTSGDEYDRAIDDSDRLLVEGAQGFSLGIHEQFYPYCTSRDVSTAQVLADCRIPYPGNQRGMAVIGVCRTYPIRVANRKSEDGQEFTSGGFYSDQHELDWKADLGREPELTTVTKLPRRIFSFSYEQIRKAARIINPSSISLTFCDYLEPKPGSVGHSDDIGDEVSQRVYAIQEATGVQVDTLSYGPDLSDIFGVSPDGTLNTHPFDFAR